MGLYENNNGSLNLLAGSTAYADAPIGAIYPYGGSTAPQGFLLCQGQAVSRTTYATLFAVIGTSFGTGDGSTTFNIPDLRNKTTFGVGSATGGLSTVGSTTAGSLPNITGSVHPGNADVYTGIFSATGAFSQAVSGSANTISNVNAQIKTTYQQATFDASKSSSMYKSTSQVVPSSVGVNFIIKALEIALPTDFEDAVDDKIAELTTLTITPDDTKVTASGIWGKKNNRIVSVTFDNCVFKNITSGGNAILTNTLPAPSVNNVYGFLMDNAGSAYALIQIVSSGLVQIYGASANTHYWGSITYISGS